MATYNTTLLRKQNTGKNIKFYHAVSDLQCGVIPVPHTPFRQTQTGVHGRYEESGTGGGVGMATRARVTEPTRTRL